MIVWMGNISQKAPVLRAWSLAGDTTVGKSGNVRNWYLAGRNKSLGRGVGFRLESCPRPFSVVCFPVGVGLPRSEQLYFSVPSHQDALAPQLRNNAWLCA